MAEVSNQVTNSAVDDAARSAKREGGASLTSSALEAARKIASLVSTLPPNYGTSAKALFIGGFVRDALLGREPKDADVEVFGCRSDELREILEKSFPGKVFVQGKKFPVFVINLADGWELQVMPSRRRAGALIQQRTPPILNKQGIIKQGISKGHPISRKPL